MIIQGISKHVVSISVFISVGLSVSNITDKHITGFSWKFQDRSGMEQGTFWNILADFWVDCFTFLGLVAAEV